MINISQKTITTLRKKKKKQKIKTNKFVLIP